MLFTSGDVLKANFITVTCDELFVLVVYFETKPVVLLKVDAVGGFELLELTQVHIDVFNLVFEVLGVEYLLFAVYLVFTI